MGRERAVIDVHTLDVSGRTSAVTLRTSSQVSDALAADGIPSAAKLILLALVLDADADGRGASLTLDRLVRVSGVDRRSVLRHLRLLAENGYIRRGVRHSDARRRTYDIAPVGDRAAWRGTYQPPTVLPIPSGPTGAPVTGAAHIRLHRVFGAGPWVCCYCGKDTSCPCSPAEHKATIEHRTPSTRGGSDDPESGNLDVACQPCNSSKRDRLYPAEWIPAVSA